MKMLMLMMVGHGCHRRAESLPGRMEGIRISSEGMDELFR